MNAIMPTAVNVSSHLGQPCKLAASNRGHLLCVCFISQPLSLSHMCLCPDCLPACLPVIELIYLYYFYHQSHDSTWCLRMSPHTGNSGKCTPFKSTEVSAANPHSGSRSGELDQDTLHSPRPRVLISPDALGLQGMRL